MGRVEELLIGMYEAGCANPDLQIGLQVLRGLVR